ncbi:MAG: EamA family transporter RarD [Phycisphaeraceae bacterium]|nr:EamA family transporter RarD [Phycisphaeraceae bacterium]
MSQHDNPNPTAGVVYGLIAYLWWGSVVPIYINTLTRGEWAAPAIELLAQRVVFGIPVLMALLWATGRLGELRAALVERERRRALLLSAALIACNWFAFIYAVANAKLIDASLGYYITPLVSIALGVVLLGERPRRVQLVSIALAVLAVGVLTVHRGGLPWIAVTLAISFGFYGLVRKRAHTKPAPGLCVEMLALLPVAIGLYAWLFFAGQAEVLQGPPTRSALMAIGGFMVVLPLVTFAAAAHRLRLATLGMLQYLAPTGQFVLSIVFGQQLDPTTLVAFALIWAALVLYSVDAWRFGRKGRARVEGLGGR